MDSLENNNDLLKSLASKMELKEGEEAVRRILKEIYRQGKIGTKDLAREARLPIPVTAAIRRELEKKGIIARKGGAVLTENGEKFVVNILGIIRGPKTIIRPLEYNTSFSEEQKTVLKKLRQYSKLRPRPNTRLDQAYATPETALKRAIYMLDEGDVEGRKLIFLGDDDLTSIAVGLIGGASKITALDIDERILKVISMVSKKEEIDIDCIYHDLRDPLPEKLRGYYDNFFTDPPYTIHGLQLFLSRGLEALESKKTTAAYIAFADKPPNEMLEVHRVINALGLYISELIPRFNQYEGAEIFANSTSQMRLIVTEDASVRIKGRFEDKMYTGELHPTLRIYKCRCGEDIFVGAGEAFNTIEELKKQGCPNCGVQKRFRLHKKISKT